MRKDLPADILSNTGLYFVVLGQLGHYLYLLVLGGNGSVLSRTDLYLVVPG